jgi:hypothetical protein
MFKHAHVKKTAGAHSAIIQFKRSSMNEAEIETLYRNFLIETRQAVVDEEDPPEWPLKVKVHPNVVPSQAEAERLGLDKAEKYDWAYAVPTIIDKEPWYNRNNFKVGDTVWSVAAWIPE